MMYNSIDLTQGFSCKDSQTVCDDHVSFKEGAMARIQQTQPHEDLFF